MKRFIKKFYLLFFFQLGVFYNTFGQSFGGFPSSYKLKTVKDNHSRLIFSMPISAKVKNIRYYIKELAAKDTANIFGNNPQKIDYIIQNGLAFSNGYVSLAPFRSEFFLAQPTDPFNLGASSFDYTLSTHEYRHVQQYVSLNKSLIKFLSFIAGDYGRSTAMFYLVPNWYFEGDAVTQETQYSSFGRGNLPLFFSGFKSIFKANKKYTYRKIRNGSYINKIPNHYELGYLLINYGYEKYGDQFWEKMTSQMSKSLLGFNRSLKKVSGQKLKYFYKNAIDYYSKQWEKEFTKDSAIYITTIPQKNLFDYTLPFKYNDSSLIVYREAYNKIGEFILFNIYTKKEITLTNKNYSIDKLYSYKNNKIVYSSWQKNPRWHSIQYNNIYLFDFNKKKGQFITHKSRLVSPDISNNGQDLIAVEYNAKLEYTLKVITIAGKEKTRFNSIKNWYYYFPKFSKNDSSCFVAISDGLNMALAKFELYNNWKMSYILPFQKRIIGNLQVIGDSLLFTTTYNSNDETWLWLDSDKKVVRIGQFSSGVYQSTIIDNQQIGSVFTADGYRLAKLPSINEIPVLKNELFPLYLSKTVKNFHKNMIIGDSLQGLDIHSYPKTRGWFRFHSWLLTTDNVNFNLEIYGQNSLNTVQSNLGYQYNLYEKYHNFNYNFIYGGWYIQPFLKINYILNRSISIQRPEYNYQINYNQISTLIGGFLPLSWFKNTFIRQGVGQVSLSYNHYQETFNNSSLISLRKPSLRSLVYLSFSNNQKQAYQNFEPRWGQRFSFYFQNGLNSNYNKTFQINQSSLLIFPGFKVNHSFQVKVFSQWRDTLNTLGFNNYFQLARGYNYNNSPFMLTASLNYAFPLFYVNWGTELIYCRRIRMNVYFDNTWVNQNPQNSYWKLNKNFASIGGECYFDFEIYGSASTSIGLGVSYKLNSMFNEKSYFYLIIPIIL